VEWLHTVLIEPEGTVGGFEKANVHGIDGPFHGKSGQMLRRTSP
jgi:hypothetical protein